MSSHPLTAAAEAGMAMISLSAQQALCGSHRMVFNLDAALSLSMALGLASIIILFAYNKTDRRNQDRLEN